MTTGPANRSKPKLLVLTPRLPYPMLAGDAIRIYQICRALSADWHITLLSLCQSPQEMDRLLPADAPFDEVHRVLLPRWKSLLQVLLALVTGDTLQIAYYRSRRFAVAARELQDGRQVVLCHLLRTAPYAIDFKGTRWLELTDHLPLTYRRARTIKGGPRSLLSFAYGFEAARVARQQQEYSCQFDQVSFVSAIDRQAFLEESPSFHGVALDIPVGVDLSQRPFVPARSGVKLAFIGNLRTLQNRDAVMFFIRDILPRLRARIPDVTVKIVGAVSADFIRACGPVQGVEFLGIVPSVSDVVADCVIGLCPIRIAAGMQNKVLDYMSLGLAVVTTTYGAEGLGARNGEHALVADEPEAFSDQVLKLLTDEEMRASLVASARRLVESRFGLEVTGLMLREAFSGGRAIRDAEHGVTLGAQLNSQ